jgi:hypothetical protein
MNDPVALSLTCRYCQHYQPEGRRGGYCQRLSAMVQVQWQSCSLAIPAFASAPEPPTVLLSVAERMPASQPSIHQDLAQRELSYLDSEHRDLDLVAMDTAPSYQPATLAFNLQTRNLKSRRS